MALGRRKNLFELPLAVEAAKSPELLEGRHVILLRDGSSLLGDDFLGMGADANRVFILVVVSVVADQDQFDLADA